MISIFCILLLAGCDQKSDDYSYLMTHPKFLKNEVMRCQDDDTLPECGEINRAGRDFFSLVSQRRDDPEVFAKKIMAAEEEPVSAEQQQKVKVLLAVVAITSTE